MVPASVWGYRLGRLARLFSTVTVVGIVSWTLQPFPAAFAVSAPVVSSVSPVAGPTAGGSVVTVNGSNLSGATKVTFGGVAGTALTPVSASQLKVTAPARAAGVVDVLVTTPGGTSAVVTGDRYTYRAAPVVSSVSPVAGPTAGGTVVTVNGSNLSGATKVTFGGVAGTALTPVSASQLKVTAPARAAGVVDVRVTTAGGTSAVVAADRYTYGARPTINGLSPASGPEAGGTTIILTGSNLASTTAVLFGATSASFSVTSATSITATPPPGSGVVDVTAETPYGTSSINQSAKYSFEPPPTMCGTLTHNETWTNNETHVLTCGITVPAGITLTLAAGTVIKAPSGLQVTVYGSLVADGTAASPVVFTSFRDDSAGGDTNADGSTSSPTAGDWSGIYASSGALLDLDHAKVLYASSAIQASAAAVSITNSTVAMASGYGITVVNTSSVPTILGNTVTNVGGWPIYVASSSVDLTRLNSNSGSGNEGNGVWLYDDTQTADATLPWSGNLLPVLRGCSSFTVPVGVTLTLAAGTVIKATSCAQLTVYGSLVADGTAASPVVFTSFRDDSAGGDTNADGSTSSPTAGDWSGIYAAPGALVALDGSSLRYASTALAVADLAIVAIHGSILNSAVGVSASNTYVDATNVDWGDPSGPAPIGTGSAIQGTGVRVVPWVGWVAPPRPPVSTSVTPTDPHSCSDVLIIGVRGAGELPQSEDDGAGDSTLYPDFTTGFGSRVWDTQYGFQQRMKELRPGTTIELKGLRYRALGALNPLNYTSGAFFESVYQGVDRLYSLLSAEHQRCADDPEKIVLAGYSEGALVIHLSLRDIAASNPSWLSSGFISAVVLIADPAKVAHGDETVWEGAYQDAGTGITKADGIWTKTFSDGTSAGPIPFQVAARTLSDCHNHDPVCAPPGPLGAADFGALGLYADFRVHTDSYAPQELNDAGAWAAELVAPGL